MLKILVAPHPQLRQKASPVAKVDRSVQELIQAMVETLEEGDRPGVGLAAPQVGQSLRIILAKEERGPRAKIHRLVNPEIVSASREKEGAYEGCLSLPNTYCLVERHQRVVVKALNAQGRKVTLKAAHLFARVLQHEIDHLDGILITDKATGKTLTEAEYKQLCEEEHPA